MRSTGAIGVSCLVVLAAAGAAGAEQAPVHPRTGTPTVAAPTAAPATTTATTPPATTTTRPPVPASTGPAPAPNHPTPSPVAGSRDASGRRLDARTDAARAAGSPIDARPVAVTTPRAPGAAKRMYPRALARRALLLPLGVVQGSAMFTLENIGTGTSDWRNRGLIDPRLRIGIGVGELELAGSFLAYEPPDTSMGETERFLTASAAAKVKILPNTAVGVELAVRSPVTDARIYAPRAIAATKLRPSTTSAVELALKTGADVMPEGDLMYVASSELRFQTQVSGEVALEARGLVAYVRPSAELAEATMTRSFFSQTYGVRLVGGISHELDVIAGFDVTIANDRDTVKLFSLGFAARRLP